MTAANAQSLATDATTPVAALPLKAGRCQAQTPQLGELEIGVWHEGQPRLGAVGLQRRIARRREISKWVFNQLACSRVLFGDAGWCWKGHCW